MHLLIEKSSFLNFKPDIVIKRLHEITLTTIGLVFQYKTIFRWCIPTEEYSSTQGDSEPFHDIEEPLYPELSPMNWRTILKDVYGSVPLSESNEREAYTYEHERRISETLESSRRRARNCAVDCTSSTLSNGEGSDCFRINFFSLHFHFSCITDTIHIPRAYLDPPSRGECLKNLKHPGQPLACSIFVFMSLSGSLLRFSLFLADRRPIIAP